MSPKNTGKNPSPQLTNRKSQKLTPEEKAWLKKFIKGSETIEAAGAELGIKRVNLYNISLKGSGAPDNINKIRLAASAEPVTA